MTLSQQRTTAEKNEADHRSQREKLVRKQPFKLAFLMRPKTRAAMVDEKNEYLPSVLVFSNFLLASDNSAIKTVEIRFL